MDESPLRFGAAGIFCAIEQGNIAAHCRFLLVG